jgi:DNA-binding NarL/FixJ family response regulator
VSGAKVLVVDDHPLSREGLALAARSALPGTQVVQAGTIADAAAEMVKRQTFKLVILDFSLPDAQGYGGMLRLQQIDPDVPIVIVTAREELGLVEAAKALGAVGFLYKSLPLDTIAAILRRVLAGHTHYPQGATPDPIIAAARSRIEGLSRAQYNVLLALADGAANKQIAYDLSITEATVKAHLTAIFRKLGVTNRSQALLAVRPLLRETDALARPATTTLQ